MIIDLPSETMITSLWLLVCSQPLRSTGFVVGPSVSQHAVSASDYVGREERRANAKNFRTPSGRTENRVVLCFHSQAATLSGVGVASNSAFRLAPGLR
jgi:hypothetical protein